LLSSPSNKQRKPPLWKHKGIEKYLHFSLHGNRQKGRKKTSSNCCWLAKKKKKMKKLNNTLFTVSDYLF